MCVLTGAVHNTFIAAKMKNNVWYELREKKSIIFNWSQILRLNIIYPTASLVLCWSENISLPACESVNSSLSCLFVPHTSAALDALYEFHLMSISCHFPLEFS